MKKWQSLFPPYEGEEPYLYLAFAQADAKKAWRLMRPLLERGCRIWYRCGPAGGAEEVLHDQKRSSGASLTLLYLTDAACADKDTKSSVLVNQKNVRQILCLDPDGTDRRLKMGLRENVPHIPLYSLSHNDEFVDAVIHADGFSQELLGQPVKIDDGRLFGKLSSVFCVLALVLCCLSFAGYRYFNWFKPPLHDEVELHDPVIQLSVIRFRTNRFAYRGDAGKLGRPLFSACTRAY